MHTHFGRVGASQNRTIGNESHLHTKTRRRNRRADTGNSSTTNNEIGGNCFIGNAAGVPARLFRRMITVRRQKNGVATSIETRKVTKSQLMLPFMQIDNTCLLPHPCTIARRTELLRKNLSIDRNRKCAGGMSTPRSGPVLCSSKDGIPATSFHVDARHGIGNRLSKTVRKQIARSHLVDKLRLDSPTSLFGELFAFYEQTTS